jgi:hypothetical protein
MWYRGGRFSVVIRFPCVGCGSPRNDRKFTNGGSSAASALPTPESGVMSLGCSVNFPKDGWVVVSEGIFRSLPQTKRPSCYFIRKRASPTTIDENLPRHFFAIRTRLCGAVWCGFP